MIDVVEVRRRGVVVFKAVSRGLQRPIGFRYLSRSNKFDFIHISHENRRISFLQFK